MVTQVFHGDVWWADLPPPTGSGAGFRRPVLVVQGDALNRTQLATTLCVPLTSNLRWADALGNVVLRAKDTGLSKDSVANVSLVTAFDHTLFESRVGRIRAALVQEVLAGIRLVLEQP